MTNQFLASVLALSLFGGVAGVGQYATWWLCMMPERHKQAWLAEKAAYLARCGNYSREKRDVRIWTTESSVHVNFIGENDFRIVDGDEKAFCNSAIRILASSALIERRDAKRAKLLGIWSQGASGSTSFPVGVILTASASVIGTVSSGGSL